MPIEVARVYDDVRSGLERVLIDRLWPRGLRKDEAPIDRWIKEVAPSTGLRRWYGHDRGRFEEFRQRYRAELDQRAEAVDALVHAADNRGLLLLTATRDLDHSHAAVLAGYIEEQSRRRGRHGGQGPDDGETAEGHDGHSARRPPR